MNGHKRMRLLFVTLLLLLAAVLMGAWRGDSPVAQGEEPPPPGATDATQEATSPDAGLEATNAEVPVYSYSAKFVCTEALQPGQFWFAPAAPIVEQKTEVLVHNPNPYNVVLFKKAVLAPVERHGQLDQGVPPGKWYRTRLAPDYAFQIDCDDIAKLLTGDPAATFLSTYGVGVTVEGFVVLGIGPQPVPGTSTKRTSLLDVTTDYSRSSEVMKKDIHYQPWWWWWWWKLPWRLGYAYQRVLEIEPGRNIDCRGMLYDALVGDTREMTEDPDQQQLTIQALEVGRMMDPTGMSGLTADMPPALVALVGRCDKVTPTAMSVDYVLLSNKGPTDPSPTQPGPDALQNLVRYPWVPGRWYDLALVTPQNLDVDIHDYFLNWQARRWIAAGEPDETVQRAMIYFLPYWCGWNYWWWWTNAGDCIDIGVGDGQSLDVESVAGVKILMPKWPPAY